ncbi:alanine racemase [Nocardioides cavernaquae]|uniref:Alanine racemase n=1 Tax=Nocardioides cavernaquae TaxID=2321396 RepID=A0A3A5HDX8_9ACTN|nr:alanine racemase [Nocardioides cavernaquae]RJS46244.1 alanine racemase [Nocardioides cavernaquae]
MTRPSPAEIVVDVAAIRHNVRRLREIVGPEVAMMTVVKADGYGHGLAAAAQAARDAGATWLGVATLEEARTVRATGDTGRLLCWLTVPGEDYRAVLEADVDVTAYSVAELDEIRAAAREVGVRARVQLKVDTGLSRGGSPAEDWPTLVAAARQAETDGDVVVTGVWSHLAASDDPLHPANDAQEKAFVAALAVAEEAGLRPEVRHLANSAAAILRPSARFDLVRCGIASYGLDPAPGETPADIGLVPAMTARARLALVKPVQAGDGVSYGHTWIADRATTVGLVPVGYADGVPRHGSNVAEVYAEGARRPIRGRVCMDQFVIDLGPSSAAGPGDEVVLFGTGACGEPTATDWAAAVGTINYEIVTRIGGRFARVTVDSEAVQDGDTEGGAGA